MLATEELAEGIIDDSCLAFDPFFHYSLRVSRQQLQKRDQIGKARSLRHLLALTKMDREHANVVTKFQLIHRAPANRIGSIQGVRTSVSSYVRSKNRTKTSDNTTWGLVDH